jgi:hypothetical protein
MSLAASRSVVHSVCTPYAVRCIRHCALLRCLTLLFVLHNA